MKMEHTSEQQNMLNQIIQREAKEAEWGAMASKLRREYCNRYSEYKNGDKVIMTMYDDSIKYGIVRMVKYSTSGGFEYRVEPTNKTFNGPTKRKAYHFYYTANLSSFKEVKSIQKVTS